MAFSVLKLVQHVARILFSLLPWALSLYLQYWLESQKIWAVDTPARAPMSVVIIATGMVFSFLLYAALSRPSR